jgi:hypothetical protein
MKILLGDPNGKVGKEDIYKLSIGSESLHNETTNNGIKMIQLAIPKCLNVSAIFPHKDIHKETRYSSDCRTAIRTDHVLISNGFRIAVTDIRALRGPDIGADHNLLKITFPVNVRAKTEKKYNERRKVVNIFQNSKWKEKYSIEVNSRFEISDNLEDEDNIYYNINEK